MCGYELVQGMFLEFIWNATKNQIVRNSTYMRQSRRTQLSIKDSEEVSDVTIFKWNRERGKVHFPISGFRDDDWSIRREEIWY
jgi:hypothetical protein